VQFCSSRLTEADVPRCNIFVYTANYLGNQFWLRHGWNDPARWKVLQKRIEPVAPAEHEPRLL
jgi:putative acetyltransferase